MAQGHAILSVDKIHATRDKRDGDIITCLLQLLTVSTAFSCFHHYVPHAISWQTD